MTQPARPKVTLAIPAFNCAETIKATLDSCLSQSYPSIKILVVDDGSTDHTSEILAGYGKRISVIRQPNGGLANARNTAMRAATGEFIAWMDADDLCMPDRLSAQVAVLETFPEVVLVSSNFNAFSQPEFDDAQLHLTTYYSAPDRLGGLDAIYPQVGQVRVGDAASGPAFDVRRGQVYSALLDGNFVHPPTVMFRRSMWQQLGNCDTSLRYSPDYEYFVRMARLGAFALLDAPLLRYRISHSQMTKSAVGGTMQLESITLMDRIRQADPPVYERHKALFERRYARSYLSAAAAIGSADRTRSLRLFWRGIQHGGVSRQALSVLLRMLLPQTFKPALRRLRRSFAGS